MARTPKQKKETVETLSNEPPEEVTPTISEPVVKASAVEKKPEKPVEVKPVKVYRVTRGGYALVNGYRTRIHEGKEVDELNFDVARLKAQGIQLTEIPASERMTAIGSSLDGI